MFHVNLKRKSVFVVTVEYCVLSFWHPEFQMRNLLSLKLFHKVICHFSLATIKSFFFVFSFWKFAYYIPCCEFEFIL